ncbi:MAG: radical SAM protein [Candidatus Gracilibacteria bacterium]|nr:radical SAM protein [Candidatus Gracilibacteria bacterium]MDD2908594.1 radical SAM protein [Candidatus Gracilibacteria bacterium]
MYKNDIIQELIPIEKSISFIVHLNNTCNFKCNYCIAGREFSKDELSLDKINTLIDSVNKLRLVIGNDTINIDINGGEPTLHKDFINILKIFSGMNNIKLQVSTNGLLLSVLDLSTIEFKDNIFFNISFHYFEYKDKMDLFIKSINYLLSNDLNFKIKFLLPDNGEKLDNFLKIKNYILEKTGIDNDKYDNYLIIDADGEISKTYDRGILMYYNKVNADIDRGHKKTNNKSTEIKYQNGKSKKYTFEDLKSKKLNIYKGYECHFISKNNISIYISKLRSYFMTMLYFGSYQI